MLMVPQNSSVEVRKVRLRIESATQAAKRNVDSVTLLAVSKAQPANSIRAVAEAGVAETTTRQRPTSNPNEKFLHFTQEW